MISITAEWSRFALQAGLMFYLSATADTDKGAEMTRKDYVAIAGAISAVRQYSYLSGDLNFQAAIDQVTGAISQVLIEDNPRFDRQRFIAATLEGAK